jgi:hypothetical protein
MREDSSIKQGKEWSLPHLFVYRYSISLEVAKANSQKGVTHCSQYVHSSNL